VPFVHDDMHNMILLLLIIYIIIAKFPSLGVTLKMRSSFGSNHVMEN